MRETVGFVVAVVLLGGCSTGMFTDRDRLKMALEEFNDGIRWNKVESSCGHLPVAARKAFAEKYASYAGEIEFMDYEVQRIEWDRSKMTADVRVEISWAAKRRGILERSVILESFQEVRGGWLINKLTTKSGAPLPLIDESHIGDAPEPAPGAAAAVPSAPSVK